MQFESKVGPVQVGDGTLIPPRLTREGGVAVQDLHGRYAEAAYRGRLFHGSTPAAGVTVPIFSNLTQQFGLWNPLGSGYLAILSKVALGYVSGTNVAGHVCYAVKPNLGVAEAVPTSVTLITATNGYLGYGQSSVMKLVSPITIAAAATYLRPMGVSQDVQPATGVNAPWTMTEDLEGSMIVSPGTAFFVASNVAAGPAICTIGLVWEEVVQ